MIELLIAVGISAVVVLAGALFLGLGNQEFDASLKRHGFKADLAGLSAHLQKHLPSGDIRFFAFSGRGSSGDNPMARAIIPLPCKLRDLSDSTDCANANSLVYPEYDKTITPAVPVICVLQTTTHNGTPSVELVVDTNNKEFGSAVFDTSGFNVTASPGSGWPGGRVETHPYTPAKPSSSLLATFSPPLATLWFADGGAPSL